MAYAAGVVVVALLGGSFGITLPVDERVDALEVQYAQNWQDQEQWKQQQGVVHQRGEIRDIRYEMKATVQEINRLNSLEEYLRRPLNDEEEWLLEREKDKWQLLQERLYELEQ